MIKRELKEVREQQAPTPNINYSDYILRSSRSQLLMPTLKLSKNKRKLIRNLTPYNNRIHQAVAEIKVS